MVTLEPFLAITTLLAAETLGFRVVTPDKRNLNQI